MSHAQPFTPEEIERLNQLEQLINQPYARMDALRKLLAAGFRPELWNELLARVERHEAKQLQAKNSRVDLKRALVRGEAWKTPEGKLDCTWPDAGDGKIAPKQTLQMLWITDLASGRLKPHGSLHSAAAILLKVKEPEEPETERQRFEKRLEAWERLASPFLKKGKADRRVESFLSRTAKQPIEDQAAAYQRFIKELSQPGDATVSVDPDSNPRARDVAENLWFICQDLRLDSEANTLDSETQFLRMNQLTEAVRLADQLKLLASKGNAKRNLRALDRRGPNKVPFAEAVREACAACLRATPGRKPSTKEILAALRAKIVDMKVVPLDRKRLDWHECSRKCLDNAVHRWAKENNLVRHRGAGAKQ